MNLLPVDRLGAREVAPNCLDFGIFLPWVSDTDGNQLSVKIIHEDDQFLQDIPPLEFPMTHSVDPRYGDYWSTRVDITSVPLPHPRSAWGQPGKYVYRYMLRLPAQPREIDWIIDPYAREFGRGKLSAITVGYQDHVWSAAESNWKVPQLADLVVYELNLAEFARGIDGAIEGLSYLADLGINCIELMPCSNVALDVDWGYLPIGYFGVDERFGKRRDLLRFIDAAHQLGIAVIVDSVYGHTSDLFAYEYVYHHLQYRENPFMGAFGEANDFGPNTDWSRELVRDFFFTVNYYWLDRYHVDGFRYDAVQNYWDSPTGQGYANLVYSTYQFVKQRQAGGGFWTRFFENASGPNLIQCAERLAAPPDILQRTYSNSAWQNGTFDAANSVATGGGADAITRFGMSLGLLGYPESVDINGDKMAKAALQYIENHDHSRFVCNFGILSAGDPLFQSGDRSLWYKVQPYLIGLLTAKGIPMLWQGEEFAENYWLPEGGLGRVMLLRPVRWDYFYDAIGRSTIGLVRKLLKLRRTKAQFTAGDHFFYNDYGRYQSRNILLFSRRQGNAFSLVALNFGNEQQNVPFEFPIAGDYREELHGNDNLLNLTAGSQVWLSVPGNYGRIWSVI